jgi:MFS family permease
LSSLYWLVTVSTTNHFAFMGTRLAVVLYGVHLGASPAVVGLLAALFGLVSAFFSVAEGRLIDRVGPVKPMLWCSLLMAAGAAFGFLWESVWSLALVSIVVGTFYSFFFIGHTQWIGRIGGPEERVGNFSLASLGFSLGTFTAPLAAGFVIENLGYGAAFIMTAAVPLIAAGALALGFAKAPPMRPVRAERGRRSIMELIRDRRLLRIYGVSVMANATWSLVGFLIPVYGTQIGLSASSIGILMGSYSIASIVIRSFLNALHRRFTAWQLMILSLSVSGVCFGLVPLVTGIGVLMGLCFLIGLAIGLSGPLSQAMLFEQSPPDRVGEVMGLRVTAMNVTQTVVPVGSGAVSAAFGNAPVFWALALVLVGGSYIVRGQWKRPRGVPRPT